MGYGVAVKVWGDYACFTRPEMKAERVSYDVTPSAARGVLEAIHWKPAVKWVCRQDPYSTKSASTTSVEMKWPTRFPLAM